jgi:hypothetical protein
VNSTRIGNRLERAIFRLLKSEIDADRFFAKKGLCQIFQKKGYYSPDRKKDIVFDVSVEVYLPGAQQYSLLVLFECKNYSHSVPVDDIEEFFAKVQQVAAANSKAVVASKSSFQSGALEFAKSKHMGLLRYFGPENFKWELLRSPSATSSGLRPDAESMVIDGLTRPDFKSEVFDLFFQTPTRATTSLANFFDDLVVGTTLSDNEVRKIANPKSRQTHTVPFREKGDLEDLAEQTLESILYSSGPVALEAICKREADAVGLSVRAGLPLLAPERSVPPLGRIQFEPLIIDLYNQDVHHLGRDRFTLAHELAHHLLGHGEFMRREFCDEDDFVLGGQGRRLGSDISRMEYQSNYFASSLLMPRTNFVADFWRVLKQLDIQDKGYGALYVDNQRCNVDNYMYVTTALRGIYHVSRAATRIRLESLGLLRDVRTGPISAHDR